MTWPRRCHVLTVTTPRRHMRRLNNGRDVSPGDALGETSRPLLRRLAVYHRLFETSRLVVRRLTIWCLNTSYVSTRTHRHGSHAAVVHDPAFSQRLALANGLPERSEMG